MRHSPLEFVFAITLATACATTPTRIENTEPTTRYRIGDYVLYRYEGSFTDAPVTVRETIEVQDGNHLEIKVAVRRGQDERQFIQVLTDTPENQKSETIDELYVLENGVRRRLTNEKNKDLYRLYEWTVPPVPGPASETKHQDAKVSLAGLALQCKEETGRFAGQEPLRFRFTTCPDFLWTNGPAEISVESSGATLWKREVVEFGRLPKTCNSGSCVRE